MSRFILSIIPIIQLVFTALSNFVEFDYVILGNVLGYSVLTNVFIGILVFKLRFCVYTKMAVIALLFMNLLCIFGTFIEYQTYAELYDLAVILLFLLGCGITYLQKWRTISV